MNKKQAYRSNRRVAYITSSIGVAMALVSIAFALDFGGISTLAPLAYKAAWGFGGCALALIACGIFALVHKPTPTELVEQTDERNVAIASQAATRAFTALSALAPFCALFLYIAEQLSFIGLFVIIGADVAAFIVYVGYIAHFQKHL